MAASNHPVRRDSGEYHLAASGRQHARNFHLEPLTEPGASIHDDDHRTIIQTTHRLAFLATGFGQLHADNLTEHELGPEGFGQLVEIQPLHAVKFGQFSEIEVSGQQFRTYALGEEN